MKTIHVNILNQRSHQKGFTLIELVSGIAIMAIIMSMFTAMVFPLTVKSVDPVLQVRATEYAQSLMKEILALPFDENTPVGGSQRCLFGTPIQCTPSSSLGADIGETRATFDDVDDFNEYCKNSVNAVDMSNSTEGLTGFNIKVCVGYDGNYDGVLDNDDSLTSQTAKLIHVILIVPQSNGDSEELHFHAYRSNY